MDRDVVWCGSVSRGKVNDVSGCGSCREGQWWSGMHEGCERDLDQCIMRRVRRDSWTPGPLGPG